MNVMTRRSLVRGAVAGALLTLPLVGAARAADQPQTSIFEQAVPLVGRHHGHLAGTTGGNFAYYRFYYPGDGTTATVYAQITPDDPGVLQTAGIKVYGPRRNFEYVSGGQRQGQSPNIVGRLDGWDRWEAGVYTVQVYNYHPNAAIDFAIWTDGLPAQPAWLAPLAPSAPAQAAATPAPTPEPTDNSRPDSARRLRAEQSGTLPGGRGGHFAFYSFNYPGLWSLKLELRLSTDDKNILKNVGYKVYGPDPGKEYQWLTIDSDGNWAGTKELWSADRGYFLVQVYNYNPNPDTVVDFTLVATNIPPE